MVAAGSAGSIETRLQGQDEVAVLPEPRPVVRTTELELARLCRRYRLERFEVGDRFEEFKKMDDDDTGTLTGEQFAQAIREQLCLGETEELPRPAESEVNRVMGIDGTGTATFEDYLQWCLTMTFSPHLKGFMRADNEVRNYATDMGLDLAYVEKVLAVFKRYDKDQSGNIEKMEFVTCLRHVMQCKDEFDIPPDRVDRFWKEVDRNGDGSISPTEFITWYMKYFPIVKGDEYSLPASMVYKRLSSARFMNSR